MKNTYRQVKVAKPMKKHDTSGTSIDNNVIDRDNRTSNNIVVPVWEKAALTVEEAAKYSNISSKTLRRFINECTPDFILKIGTKTLIKRKMFEKFLESTDAI